MRGAPTPIQTQGHRTQSPSRHSTRPLSKRQGGRQHTDGDADIQRGGQHSSTRPSLTMPPTIRYATPPSTTAPPTTTTRGEQTEDTPPHEHHRHTPTTHAPHTWQGTVRDMTAVLASTAMGRVGHEPHHRTGQDNSSTHHRHSTHREGWTPSTHPLIHSHTVHVHTTNERS